MMKQLLIMVLLLLATGTQAQIPTEVKDLLKKCAEKNRHEGGAEVDMKLHIGAVIASMNGTMKVCTKGDKSFTTMRMKAMGHEMYTETGFDGTQEWEYTKATDKDERDTLIITKTAQKRKKGKFSIDFGLDKDYKNAKLKTTSKFYEIVFTGPLKEDTPKKTVLRIVKDTYMLHQLETKVSIASMTMTVTKVKVGGINENVFVLDTKKYPNAVVVRK